MTHHLRKLPPRYRRVPLQSTSLIACALLAVVPQAASAQSLFERRSANQIDQYRNFTARDKGDLLTVLINETTAVQNRDERSLDKSGQSTYGGGLNYGLDGGLGSTEGAGTLGHTTTSQRGFAGDTEFRSERQFSDRFAVTIMDVLPNGNFVVSGHRKITVQGDVRELHLSGIVRQYDVLPNNMVPSHLVANLKIELGAEGVEQSFNNQGWFSRAMNRVWPF